MQEENKELQPLKIIPSTSGPTTNSNIFQFEFSFLTIIIISCCGKVGKTQNIWKINYFVYNSALWVQYSNCTGCLPKYDSADSLKILQILRVEIKGNRDISLYATHCLGYSNIAEVKSDHELFVHFMIGQ